MARGCAVELQPQRCRSTLWPNVLSVVRKSRNSSGGLYRCRRRSAHDRRRTNAMRFLMNTLLAHPVPRLIHAFRQNPLWIRSGSRRCLRVLCEAPLSPSELTGVGQLQLSTFGASSILLFKAAGTLIYASKIAPCLVCASSRTVLFPDALATSGVGFVQPSSRSPRSPHLKSHSRQRRPTRLQVMTGNRGSELVDNCVTLQLFGTTFCSIFGIMALNEAATRSRRLAGVSGEVVVGIMADL